MKRVFVIVDRYGRTRQRLEFPCRADGKLTADSWRKVYAVKKIAWKLCCRFVDCGVNS